MTSTSPTNNLTTIGQKNRIKKGAIYSKSKKVCTKNVIRIPINPVLIFNQINMRINETWFEALDKQIAATPYFLWI